MTFLFLPISIKGQGFSTKSCGGQVTASSKKKCKDEGIDKKLCETCEAEYPCDNCMYHPIYPCYTPKQPLIACLQDYKNDYTVQSRDPGGNVSMIQMYEKMTDEGHDARLFRFSPSSDRDPADNSIKGSHQTMQNEQLWMVGCLGLTAPCSEVVKSV